MDNYREIFDKFPDGVTLHDARDGAILDTNEEFCEMLGYSREELLELDFEDLHLGDPPYTNERAEQYVRRAATEGPQTFEWMDEKKNGDLLPVEVNLRQTTIGGDRRILAVVRDITERKQREKELKRKNERLEEFASVVSHDLQSPLSVAVGRLALAQETCDTHHLEAVGDALERMQLLTEDLLSLAREGQKAIDIQPVDLPTVIERSWRTVETEDATLDVDTGHGEIHADESRLQQLLENLLRNAVEHGGRDVTVTVGDLDDGFYVADDGPGIPPNQRDQVFETGNSTKNGGTGFGLNIVEQVAESHDWGVDITDSSNGGARFEVSGVGESQ